MNKKQWYNLYHSFRYMKRFCNTTEVLAWIQFYNKKDREIIEKII